MSDRDKELANNLVSKYISVGCLFANAIKCAKIDLQNRIELLNGILKVIDREIIYDQLQSLENQLTHLNNL